ncbi:MAG: hypothetical protein ACMXYL_03685 [Candidatus Woesearchaeota archaeon]
MVSIARSVEHNIRNKPFLEQALSRGIVNYAALADEIIVYVEKDVGRKVKHSAVMMALRRLAEKLDNNDEFIASFEYDKSIQVRDGLIEYTIVKNTDTIDIIRQLISDIDYSKGDFLTFSHVIHEITLLIDAKNGTKLSKRITSAYNSVDNLSSLTLFVPEQAKDSPGFFYIITKELAWENISIKEVVSTENELSIIVSSDDIPRVFSIIQILLKKYRQ